MTERKHRPRWGIDTVSCRKCEKVLPTVYHTDTRFGVCPHCGWENRGLTRRGLAPTEGSKNDSSTKLLRHKLKRERRNAECLHLACTECSGTGVNRRSQPCIHMISCPCSNCSPAEYGDSSDAP